LIGFGVALVALLGKLEKVPFDSPEAETEIVAGAFTEYSGRRFAFFRLALDIELVVGASLIAAVFLPWGLDLPERLGLTGWLGALIGYPLYLVKITLVVVFLTVARTVFARLRIDQMVRFCWTYLAPAAFVQVIFSLIMKGILP
jgi:NADH-quinone oxidoreductase subunit H